MTALVVRLAACCLAWSLPIMPVHADIPVEERVSPDGRPFWLVREMSIPIVALEIEFPLGSWTDPEGLEGVSRFAMAMMSEGAGDLDAVAFAARRSDLAARFGFGAGRDAASISARLLVETLDESVALMRLAMTEPRFDPDAVERVRRRIQALIAQGKESPRTIAAQTWFARAFPAHPYGRTSRGTEESVAAITVEDLRAAHRRLLIGTGANVVVVGAVDAPTAGRMIDGLLSGLPEGAVRDAPPAESAPPAGVHVIEKAVPQSMAFFGHLGIPRSDPDYVAAVVMNHILGGGFTSRLTQEVRERRGLAYSVSTNLAPMNGAALHLGSVSTANARIAESLAVIRAEWGRMAAGEVTEEDVAAAKTYLTGSFPLGFDSNAGIADYLVWAMGRGLDSDYVNRRNALVEAVDVADVRRVAARLLDADALSVVVVGRPEGL